MSLQFFLNIINKRRKEIERNNKSIPILKGKW